MGLTDLILIVQFMLIAYMAYCAWDMHNLRKHELELLEKQCKFSKEFTEFLNSEKEKFEVIYKEYTAYMQHRLGETKCNGNA